MSRVIAVVNEKGGVGKTTSATAIAYILAQKGKKVLLVDFDGQAHASMVLGVENVNMLDISVADIMRMIVYGKKLPPKENFIFKSNTGIDLVPSNSDFFNLERILSNSDFRETKLKEFIDEVKGDYDFVIIDSLPVQGTMMINVMLASDEIIIPTQSEFLSTQSLQDIIDHFHNLKSKISSDVKISGILITMDSRTTILSREVSEMIDSTFKGVVKVFETKIPRSIKVGEASLYSKTICEYDPDHPVSLAYSNLVEEIL